LIATASSAKSDYQNTKGRKGSGLRCGCLSGWMSSIIRVSAVSAGRSVGVSAEAGVGLMRRRPEDVGGWVLNGVVYPSEAARDERVAFDERCRARRVRLLARIEAEREGFLEEG
jgi:hypothetical protein